MQDGSSSVAGPLRALGALPGLRPIRQRRLRLMPTALLAPALAVTLALSFGPLLYGLWLSLHHWYLLDSPAPVYQGLQGYRELLADAEVWTVFGRTIIWTAGTVAIEVALGMGFALLLDRPGAMAERLSAVLLLPWATPFIVAAYGWQYLLDARSGPLHSTLRALGLVTDQSVLADPHLALAVLTFISGWKGTPFMAIALLAALKTVPAELHEAAAIDGASAWQRLRAVTWPLIQARATVTAIVLGVLAFYSFDLPWIMTKGGPGTATTLVGVRIYEAIFVELEPTLAATISSTMLGVLLVFTVLLRLGKAS